MINAPMYRPDLDIVVEYKDDSLVSSCTIWFDKQNNIGMFEPVGTHYKSVGFQAYDKDYPWEKVF